MFNFKLHTQVMKDIFFRWAFIKEMYLKDIDAEALWRI